MNISNEMNEDDLVAFLFKNPEAVENISPQEYALLREYIDTGFEIATETYEFLQLNRLVEILDKYGRNIEAESPMQEDSETLQRLLRSLDDDIAYGYTEKDLEYCWQIHGYNIWDYITHEDYEELRKKNRPIHPSPNDDKYTEELLNGGLNLRREALAGEKKLGHELDQKINEQVPENKVNANEIE